jgi:hypothetical protein
VAVLVAVSAGAELAGGTPASEVVPPSQRVAGKTYPEWMVASWQWILANGRAVPATPPRSFKCLRTGQHGKVFFLQDEYEGGGSITVSCVIPAATYVLLEGPVFECSTIEASPFGALRGDLKRCLQRFQLAGTRLTLDGAVLTPSAYPVATPVFRFTIPATNNVLHVAGQTHGYSAAKADASMLRPLSAGRHTLVQREQFSDGSAVETTWKLKVR